jgi:hypothetical protein
MATIGEIIFKLIEDSGVVPDRKVFPIEIPQKTTINGSGVVVYNVISTTPTNTKQEGSTLDRYRIQVSIFSTNYDNCYAFADQIRTVLENVINQDVTGDGTITQCSTFEGQVDGIDSFSGLQGIYYIHQDYYFWLTRTI